MEFKFEDMPYDVQARLIRERLAELAGADTTVQQMMAIFFKTFGTLHFPTTRLVRRRN